MCVGYTETHIFIISCFINYTSALKMPDFLNWAIPYHPAFEQEKKPSLLPALAGWAGSDLLIRGPNFQAVYNVMELKKWNDNNRNFIHLILF